MYGLKCAQTKYVYESVEDEGAGVDCQDCPT